MKVSLAVCSSIAISLFSAGMAMGSPRGLDFERNAQLSGKEFISFDAGKAGPDSCYDLLSSHGKVEATVCKIEGGWMFLGKGGWGFDTAGKVQIEVAADQKVSLVYHQRRNDAVRASVYREAFEAGAAQSILANSTIETLLGGFSEAGGDLGKVDSVQVQGDQEYLEFVILGEGGKVCLGSGQMDRRGSQGPVVILP